jgi:hypothetical protein
MAQVFMAIVVFAFCSSACTKKNPNYCETNEDCTDPELPYCDSFGAVGPAHSCLRCPPEGCPLDGGVDGSIDATDAAIDAPIDAPPQPAVGLGKVCDVNPCPTTGATECLGVNQAGTPKFCTLSCGTTPIGSPTPPSGGDAICQQSMPAPPSGHAACVFSGPPNDPMTWYCGIRCGVQATEDYGECPAGLTCTSNVCQ